MNSHCYIGATDPSSPHLARTRFVRLDADPGRLLPTLAAIWAGHARYDTQALLAAILACDWEHLDPHTPAIGRPGHHRVPGVGTAAAPGWAVDVAEPVTVFPLCHARHLDVDWIYLIEAATATVAVHAGDGDPIGRYPLAGFLPPPAAPGRCVAGPGMARVAA